MALPASAPAGRSGDEDLFWPAKPDKPGEFTVQVASTSSDAEARREVDRFRAKGFEAYCYRAESGRYPVRVGRYQTEVQARAAKTALEAAGARGPYISKLNP
jgi:cell division septation protein DedD